MTPVIPQPDPVALPAPTALLGFLLLLTFTLHVVPMNLVLGGSILGAIARWRATRGQAHDAELARWIGKAMPVLISAAVTMGVAALLFLQVLYGRLFFVSSILMASLWLAVVPLLIVMYYSAYAVSFRGGRAPLWLSCLIAAVALVVAFVYANNMSLMIRPGAFRGMYAAGAGGFHLDLGDPMLLPRFLHVVTGAVAVSAIAIVVLGVATRHTNHLLGGWAVQYGSAWFAGATIVNLVFGVWLLATLPASVLLQLVGRNALMTSVVGAAVLFAGVSLGFVMAAAKAREPSRAAVGAAVSLLITVVLMIVTRDFVRRALTTAAGFEMSRWVVPQWGPIVAFALLLVGALATVAWMVRALVGSPAPASPAEVPQAREHARV